MSLSDLLAAEYGAIGALVADREARDFLRPTGASAWCVQDLLFHQLLDAQRALVTIASPSDAEPDRDAVTYWHEYHPARGDGGAAHARFVRVAASAYSSPDQLVDHWQETAAAAARAVAAAPADGHVATQGHVLTVPDFVSTLLLEATVHHLDLLVGLDGPPPATGALAETRRVLDCLLGRALPGEWDDVHAVLAGTGRRALDPADRELLGESADRFPLLG